MIGNHFLIATTIDSMCRKIKMFSNFQFNIHFFRGIIIRRGLRRNGKKAVEPREKIEFF